jgi:hypothetical protein
MIEINATVQDQPYLVTVTGDHLLITDGEKALVDADEYADHSYEADGVHRANYVGEGTDSVRFETNGSFFQCEVISGGKRTAYYHGSLVHIEPEPEAEETDETPAE